jgi:hypothetical protein
MPENLQKKTDFYAKDEAIRKTYYDEYVYAGLLNAFPSNGNGSVTKTGLTSKNPLVQVPVNPPPLTKEQVVDAFKKTLEGHPKKGTYIIGFYTLWDNSETAPKAYKIAGDLCLQYLRLIADEIQKPTCDADKAKKILIEIGERCSPGICLPGRVATVQLEYQRFTNAATEDELKFAALQLVEEFKTNILIQIFSDSAKTSAAGSNINTVHIIAHLQSQWKDQAGFNPPMDFYGDTVGSSDMLRYARAWNPNITSENVYHFLFQEFTSLYRKIDMTSPYPNKSNLFRVLYEAITGQTDENKIIINVGLYQERVRKILKDQGYDDGDIETKISLWFPDDDNGIPGMKIAPEAIELVLQDIGLLNG